MNRERILAVLYDLAMVIGGEVNLRPLLTKTLQRLLYHTSFPAGAVFLDVSPQNGSGKVAATIELAIGDYELAGHAGETLVLPAALFSGAISLEQDRSLIDVLPCHKGAYSVLLKLPIDGNGVVVLLSPSEPLSDLPLTQVFQPVMANLAKAILLCRRNEAYTKSIISDRDRAESGLKRFHAALNATADSVFLVDPFLMHFVDFNLSAETSSGYARVELLSLGLQNLLPSYPRDQLEHLFGALLRGESSILDLDTTLRRKDGSEYQAALRFNLFSHASEQLVIAMVRDVSEYKRLENELRLLNENLERRVEDEVAKNREKDHLLIQQSRLAAMGEMVHNIAHQWRQPLNALSLILTNIKDDFDYQQITQETLDRDVKKARSLLQGMSTTIDDFRDFFRPDREPGDFELGHAVDDALFVMAASLKNNNIEVVKALPGGMLINGFSNQLAQVVLNILANAKEAIQLGNVPAGRIGITLVREGNNGVLSIEDNAGGIPDDVLPRIFDPYFTTKEQGSG
ncbi:MAG: PAS domain S-box protein, partial [Sulfuricella sp.]